MFGGKIWPELIKCYLQSSLIPSLGEYSCFTIEILMCMIKVMSLPGIGTLHNAGDMHCLTFLKSKQFRTPKHIWS